jgi:hypothetical protein
MPTRRKTTSAGQRQPESVPTPGSGAEYSGAGNTGPVLSDEPGKSWVQGNFYSEVLQGSDPASLDKVRRIKLLDEIVLLRVVMRRVVQQVMADLPGCLADTLNSLSQAATRLARLLTLEQTLAEGEDNDLGLLAQAINRVMKEQGW